MIQHYMCYRNPHVSFTEPLSSEKTKQTQQLQNPLKAQKTQTDKPPKNQNPDKLPR